MVDVHRNPLDYRNTQCIADVVSTFGQFHYWNSNDRRKVRSLVRASFPDNALLPRSVTFREFVNWGDTVVSWSAGCYILSGEFAGAMIPANEDPMPLDGNPHPMPGVNPPQPFWAMPPHLLWVGMQCHLDVINLSWQCKWWGQQ